MLKYLTSVGITPDMFIHYDTRSQFGRKFTPTVSQKSSWLTYSAVRVVIVRFSAVIVTVCGSVIFVTVLF